MKDQIKKVLEDVTNIKDPDVGFASDPKFGDYSTSVALKNKDLDPNDIAKKINNQDLPFTATVVGKFINFWLTRKNLVSGLKKIREEGEKYGKSDLGKGKLVIVEYSSPNIAKPFGVGHLRSTVIGDAIANLMEASGYKVMRDNHLGDWGTQFGKIICAIKRWGDETEIEKSRSPVEGLVQLYVKFHEASKENPKLEDEARSWFKKLEDGDPEARRLWQKCVDWSWIEFDKIYKLLGIKFDKEFSGGRGLGESFFETKMKAVIKEIGSKKLLKVGEEGARLVFFKDDKYPPLMIIKNDGATLYATRDLATDKYRKEEYNPDRIINEVGSEQGLYFKQIFEIEKLLGWYQMGQRVHVGHGLYLMGGKKMSTRAGKTVKLDGVLTEAIEKAKKLGSDDNKIAKMVGIGAIKYFDLLHQPMTNINFDWDSMFAMEGNSGPYLQYTVARCNSVLTKVKGERQEEKVKNEKIRKDVVLHGDYSTLNEAELSILRLIIKFSEVIQSAARSYSPNLLCNYLYELSQKFNTFYNADRIIGSDNEDFRLLLASGVAQVLKNGLKILGIDTPERM